MDARLDARAPAALLRPLTPQARIVALADEQPVDWLDAPRPSAHLARYGIAAQPDDGVVTARIALRGRTWLVAAQDERFVGGSVGAAHGDALRALFDRARVERVHGIALLAASGGVRLHEANAAELALARALRALLAARSAGIVTAALAVGDVFGGASVLACAMAHVAMMPGARLGLSGPKVVETARGRTELDAADGDALEAVYGTAARVRNSPVALVRDDAQAVVEWLSGLAPASLAGSLAPAGIAEDDSGARAPGPPLDLRWRATPLGGGVWRTREAFVVAPFSGRAVDAQSLRRLDATLLAEVGVTPGTPLLLVVLEDSDGHELSRAAEEGLLSADLARHAAVYERLRCRGVRIVGALTGTGHSAAFFANALQADALCAARAARVVAMSPQAIARVTGLAAADRIEHDALLGHPVRHLAALDPAIEMLDDASPDAILAFARRAIRREG